MTYGWAILIIALSLVVLYSLGIMNPKNFVPRAPPGSCFVFRPNGPGTTDFVSLQGTCGYLPMYVASFNGVDGYVDIPSLNYLSSFPITVGLWLKMNSPNPSRDQTPSGQYSQLYLDNPQNTYVLRAAARDTNSAFRILVITNNWQVDYKNNFIHIVLILKQTNLSVYVNGVYKGYVNATSVYTFTLPNKWSIGRAYPTYFTNCSIANIQIYNTALTPQEIQYLYQQGLGGGPVRLQNLVAWWPLNGDAKDYSGNNNHGTIYNVAFVQNYNPP